MTSGTRPFIPAANTASIELWYTYLGSNIENVWHCYKGSPYSLADLQAVRTIVNTWDIDSWQGQRASGSVAQHIRTKALDTNTSPMEDYNIPGGRGGTGGGANQPGNVTFCVKLSSGLQGRSTRGRTYVPGLSSGMLAAVQNQVTGAYAGNVVASLQLLQTRLAAGGHTLCIVSYRHDKAWRVVAEKYAVASISAVDFNVDSQRRRLTGRGRT